MNLRKHQRELLEIAKQIACGNRTAKTTVANITPGGGKTLAAILFARELLDAGVITHVCWVCPRTTLAKQAERDANGRTHGVSINKMREGKNVAPLIREADQEGYITTYQSVASLPDLHRMEFERGKYLLILDEPHHMSDEASEDVAVSWSDAIAPIVDLATHVLAMTGTIERHDGTKIPFIEYERRGDREFPIADVTYSRRDALREQAVLKMDWELLGGTATYWKNGVDYKVDIEYAMSYEKTDVFKTIFTEGEWWRELIERGFQSWSVFREQVYKSTMIVICEFQSVADRVAKYIREKYALTVDVATDDKPNASDILRDFRERRGGDVLVTVAMAYEGFDSPHSSHLVCMTHKRSKPWLDQAFARVVRIYRDEDVPYESQRGFIFAPRDPWMVQIVEAMQEEQLLGVDANRDPVDPQEKRKEPEVDNFIFFKPITSESGASSFATLDGCLSEDQNEVVRRFHMANPIFRLVPPEDILKAALGPSSNAATIKKIGAFQSSLRRDDHGRALPPDWRDDMTPSEKERCLRANIEVEIRRWAKSEGIEPAALNGALKKRFGDKSRVEMSSDELLTVLNHVYSVAKRVPRAV